MDSSETLALLKASLAKASTDDLAKATFTQPSPATTGLQSYDLEPVAKNLYPVLTPLRNQIPRVKGAGSIQTNWKSVTGINTSLVFPGVTEGRRGGVQSFTMKDNYASYRTIGIESSVTYEAELAAEGFDDIKARASMMNLQALMIQEEQMIVGGNTSYPLGVTPTPALAVTATGGTLGAQTLSVICVALSYYGMQVATVATGVLGQVTRTTADGYTDTYGGGSAIKSGNVTAVLTGTTNQVLASVAPVRGAFGYAWFWGAAGSEVLGAISHISATTITAAATGTQLASSLAASDNSANALVHDGLLSMAAASANGAYYYAAAANTGLTPDDAGGIIEFDTMLQYMWDNLRLSPSRCLINSQEMLWIRRKILTGNSNTNTRFVFNVNQGQITGGGVPKGYLNPFAAGGAPQEIPFQLHPNMPPGTILFLTEQLPYPMNNIDSMMKIRTRKDYYQIDWPQRSRQYEYGTYSDQVLQHYFMPSMGLITNLAAQ